MSRFFRFLFAVVALSACGLQADAATFEITPTFAGAFDGSFEPIPGYDPNAATSPAILQVDFVLNYQGTNPFGAVVFDVALDNLIDTSVPGWQPNNPTIDSNGSLPGGNAPLFANNGDFGTAGDLVDVTAGIAAGLTNAGVDPRLAVGTGAGNDLLGSLFLDYAGGNASVSVNLTQGGYSQDGVLTVDTDPTFIANTLNIVPEDTGGGDPVAVGDPESGSMISLQGAFDDGSGMLPEAIMVMNDNPQSDPPLQFDVDDLIFTQNDEGLFGADINPNDSSKIDLMIDVDAARQGSGRDVMAVLQIQTNGGTLEYQLTASVPEPSTVALAGLAMVGLVGFARRK